jgi:hypothetical protein
MARVTVLSGPERRRRWASSEKARIVEESLLPGAVVTAAGSIEIELAGDVRVRVDAAVDEAALGRVLRALGR